LKEIRFDYSQIDEEAQGLVAQIENIEKITFACCSISRKLLDAICAEIKKKTYKG